MRNFVLISFLLFLVSDVAFSRSIRDDNSNLISDGVNSESKVKPSFLEWSVSGSEGECEAIYGFLPCSTNVWGLLFLIVVYEILLSLGEKYVGQGSEMFFQITGPTVFGASLFQFLGTIPQIVLVLVTALSGTTEAAQQRVTLGMGLVAGSTVMFLTLIWGSCVVFGSYDFVEANNKQDYVQIHKKLRILKGSGVITDIETSYTARIMLISLVPFVFLLLGNVFVSTTWKRIVYLLALILTIGLLLSYILYQIFQPWIQTRRFEGLMNKYAKDKLLTLLSRNGKPDVKKIQGLFETLDKNKSSTVSATELRVLLFGLKIDDNDNKDDLETDRDVENIMTSFDISGDGQISQDEFVKGMKLLVLEIADDYPDRVQKTASKNPQERPKSLNLSLSMKKPKPATSWIDYAKALFFVILGTVILCLLAEPLITNVVSFANAANLSSFWVSYLVIPLALNYNVALQSITAARQKSRKTISLTLSSLYGAVYMNNIIGLIVFLTPVYIRDLAVDVSAEVVLVLLICIVMSIFTSLRTMFHRWTSYLVLLLYPISLAIVYVFTSVFGWS